MKKIALLFVTLVVVLSFAGCSARNSVESKTGSAGGVMPQAKAPAEQSAKSEFNSADSAPTQPVQTDNSHELDSTRKIIYNASVMLDVKNLNEASESIISKARAMGGYVANSSINEYNCQITVRVPSDRLDEFLKYIDTLGGQNKQSSINTDDITDQYTDTESRIRNLKAQEAQLLEIMKKAETVEDILKVQDQLYSVRGEIESLEGRINMWNKLVEMSTVNISMNKITEIVGKDVKLSPITWDEIARGISNGFNATLNFIIRFFTGIFVLLVSVSPLLPFIAVGVWLLIRYIKKAKKKMNK